MGEPILQVANRANWQEAYNASFVAAPAGNNRFYPLLPVVMPVLLTSPIVALGASNPVAPPHWQYGYSARQYIGGTGLGALEGRSFKAMLGRLMIARFPMLAAQYQLRFNFPYWHQKMDVVVYEYVGELGDSTEALIQEQSDLIRIDLIRIDAKIDAQ